MSGEIFLAGLDSLHFWSEKDPMAPYLRNYLNYERPTVIEHNQGHRPVKTLDAKDVRIMADFFARQYTKKNKDIDQSQSVKNTLESFYSSLETSSMLPRKTS